MANTHSLDLESGSSQYASITDASQTGLDITGDITIEAWFKPEAAASTQTIASKYNTSGNQRGYIFFVKSNDTASSCTMDFYVSADGSATVDTLSVVPTDAIPIGTWSHLAMKWDASTSTVEFFIDGVSQGTDTGSLTSIFNNTAAFELGTWSGGSWYLDGLIDDVRVWSDLRTDAEIADNDALELVGTEANLEGYWKLNNDYTDETSNGNDLTASGSPVFSTDVPFTGEVSFTTAETLSLSETWTVGKQTSFNISETLALSETWSAAKSVIFNITETLGLVEILAQVKQKWNNITKNSATMTNESKNSASMTAISKNSSTWTNQSKN